MSGHTSIAWCDATWNPIRGCSRISDGCRNCYAERVAARFSDRGQPFHGFASASTPGREPLWSGKVQLVGSKLDEPIRWQRPRRIFVNSMSDLFHEQLRDDAIGSVFNAMAKAPQHQFLALTKRAARMRRWVTGYGTSVTSAIHPSLPWPLPNVWLGVSVEDQRTANERIPILLDTPAAIHFVSAEPLLEQVDLTPHLWGRAKPCEDCPRDANCLCGHVRRCEQDDEVPLDWVIVGGESGPYARLCKVSWIRSIVDQCRAAHTACFVKQLGSMPHEMSFEAHPQFPLKVSEICDAKGADPAEWPDDLVVRQFPQPLIPKE